MKVEDECRLVMLGDEKRASDMEEEEEEEEKERIHTRSGSAIRFSHSCDSGLEMLDEGGVLTV